MMVHQCRDIPRDEAVRAAEDKRSGPLPTLEQAIAQAFGFDEASVQRACDETKTWPDDVQADAKRALADLLEQGVPRIQALADASRWGKRLFEARYPEMMAKSGSASSAVEHENKGDDMTTKAEIQAADYRAEAMDLAEPPGLRTERVVLEVTVDQRRIFFPGQWQNALRQSGSLMPGESVRVVEERVGSVDERAYADRMGCDEERDFAYRILAERDKAIRERDELRDSYRHCRAANNLVCDQRDTLRTRVASLESQLESVADRAAAAETALESAPAANELPPPAVFIDARHDPIAPTSGERLRSTKLSTAASGAAGTEPVAWGVMVHRDAEVLCVPFPIREAANHFVRLNCVNETMTVVPLHAAPQPAKGWLTPDEREAIMYLIANRSQFAPQTPHEERRNAASRVCHALLARSSPPEVVLPVSTIGRGERYDGDWVEGWIACRERCAAALAAAGVKVKEVK